MPSGDLWRAVGSACWAIYGHGDEGIDEGTHVLEVCPAGNVYRTQGQRSACSFFSFGVFWEYV